MFSLERRRPECSSHSLPVPERVAVVEKERWDSDGTRDDRLQGKLPLDIGKIFFTTRTTKPWNKLLREVVEYPSQELLETWLGRALDNVI